MGLLDGKVIVITGGFGGQGRAHAEAGAREGANIALIDLEVPEPSAYADLTEKVESNGGRLLGIKANVTSQSDIDCAISQVVDEFGKIDSMIINAGTHRAGLFWEMSEEDWDKVIDVNLTAAWKSAKAVVPQMIKQESGSIIMISSVDAFDAESESTAYGVSKAGVLGLMKYVAFECGPYGVRCNAIAPGFVDTPMVNSQEMYDLLAGQVGKGTRDDLVRYGHEFTNMKGVSLLEPLDIADTAVYLNSRLARHVTGVVVPVDAGHLLVSRVNRDPVY